jgi:mannose-6-phosphate isomerase-like protein (cupin superfamily)
MPSAIDLADVVSTLSGTWAPLTIATLNDYDVRVVKTGGEFTWHSHAETDEFFLVLRGLLIIRLEGDDEVALEPGQVYVVPRGTRHQPYAPEGADVLLIEPSSTVNTGDSPGRLTAPHRVLPPK